MALLVDQISAVITIADKHGVAFFSSYLLSRPFEPIGDWFEFILWN